MHLDKHAMKNLPNIFEDPEKKPYAEYVMSVMSGEKKSVALKEFFPDRYDTAVKRAGGNQRVINANVTRAIRQLERSQLIKDLYKIGHKDWWIAFLEKKQNVLMNLYTMSMDTSIIPRDRIAASKVMLEHMPEFNEDRQIVDDVKEEADAFINKLKDMQRKLYKTANAEPIETEVIDVKLSEA